jgi:Peptidase family C25
MSTDKLIITNRSVLKAKYGTAGFNKIIAAVKKLITADKKRSVNSLLVYVDDAATAKKVKGKPVVDASDPEQIKNIIDRLFWYYTPDYMMLLGASDVIPHCKFKIEIPDDDDPSVPSDVPYACEAPFSRRAGDFIAPSRVLGRLPDINGVAASNYLVHLINNSIRWKPISETNYKNYFSLSVKWWNKSTKQSLKNIFGSNTQLKLSPPTKGPYSKKELSAMMHFFNCHGALMKPEFYGQPSEESNSFPVCFDSSMINEQLTYGTVAAAECCYGGALYKPSTATGSIKLPIPNAYLFNNAIGYIGSSTIAYGPPEGQGAADYITQYFLIAITKGASTGRAFLEAQQRFIEKGDVKMDPMDLKTIIQFMLLGDPSLSPVQEMPKNIPGKTSIKSIQNKKAHDVKERKERRMKLAEKSVYISNTNAAPVKLKTKLSGNVKKEIDAVLKKYKFKETGNMSYGYSGKKSAMAKATGIGEFRYHVYSKRSNATDTRNVRLLVIQEMNKQIMEIKEYVRK